MINADLEQIKRELEAAGHGGKSAVLDYHAGLAGVSRVTLYRAIQKKFGSSREVQRERRVDVDDVLIREVAKIKEQGRMLTRGADVQRELSTSDCIRMLVDKGLAGADHLTVSTVNRRLEQIGYRERDPKVRVEAPYANRVWQMDFSRSKYFQLRKWDPARRDFLMKVHGRELHYKVNDARMRTWITSVVDEYSRVEACHAFAASGESWVIGLDMLHRIFNREPSDPHPLRHVPERLKTDNGAFIKRAEVRAALDAFGIECKRTRPGNHDSQGKIEKRFSIIWNKFELPLAIRLGAGSNIWLSEYNELLHEFTIERLSLEHPLFFETRGATYARSVQSRVQLTIESDILQHAFRVDYRTVADTLLFSFGGLAYRAPYWAQNRRVRVYRNLNGQVLVESIEDGRIEAAVPPANGEKFPHRDLDDFEHGPAATYRQQIETELGQEARAKAGNPDTDRGWLMYQEGNKIFMPPRTAAVDPASPFEERKEETEYRSADLARVAIGAAIYEISEGEWTYDDFRETFEPILAVTLSKETVARKIEDLRTAARSQRMGVIRNNN
ncbi:transposase family protein [bacterium]|nr:transposase family protein [bacterium]